MSSKFKNLPQQYLQSNPNKTNNTQSQIFPLSSSEFSVGRTHQNSLQILDNTVSKKHGRIALLKGSYYIYDNDSANGVYVNGEKIQGQIKLEDGDHIQFGKYPCLYKFVDRNSAASTSKGKGKINLKDYLFQDNAQHTNPNKTKINNNQFVSQQSNINDQSKYPNNMSVQSSVLSGQNRKKVKTKQSKIKIPNISDYLKLVSDEPDGGETIIHNRVPVSDEKFKRNKLYNKQSLNLQKGAKESKIKLQSLQMQAPNDEDLKQYRLEKKQRNIYAQQQQALRNIQKQKRRVEQFKLKKQLQQAKIAEDLLQKQLLLQQKVREQQQKVEQEKQKLQQEFVKRQQIRREEQARRLKQMEEKEKQMIDKIQQERNKQIQQLKLKQQIIKRESDNQYRNQYQNRKKQLQIEAQALARQYQAIYRQTIKKVRTQIDNQQNTIQKMQENQQLLLQSSKQLDDQIIILKQQLEQKKNQFIKFSGRNRAWILYASDVQDKIDALGTVQSKQNQQGYYKNILGPKNGRIKKLQQSVTNSRKLLKIKQQQYGKLMQDIRSLSVLVKERQYNSGSDINDFLDTILQNLQTIQKLKQEYLQYIQSQRAVQQVWDAELQQNNELQSKNRILEAEVTKNIREIDDNLRDQIKKSTEQRLHMLKVIHFCPQQKKNAAKFLIQQMLNIEQQIHKFKINNQEAHRKIVKIISQTQKYKRENEYLSQILFSQDENGHHFDNMKIVITNLINRVQQQRSAYDIADCLQLARESMKSQLMIQQQLQRKKKLRDDMRKISQMGIAPGQVKLIQKNPLSFFGDLLTAKQIQIQKRKSIIDHLANQSTSLKNELKLLEDKKSKVGQVLQKYKVQQLSQAKKYLKRDGYR